MRSFLAVLWLLTVAGIARTEFDAAGVASAKPKATGAIFDSGAANKPEQATTGIIAVDAETGRIVKACGVQPGRKPRVIRVQHGFCCGILVTRCKVKHRPANIPSSHYFISPEYPGHISPERVHGGIQ
jgi:hypothetical protein